MSKTKNDWTQVKVKKNTVNIIKQQLMKEGDKLQFVADDLLRLALKVKKIDLEATK